MTGAEHYEEAEKLLIAANKKMSADGISFIQTPERRAELRAEAQVRATLALVYAANRAQTEAYGLLRVLIDAQAERIAGLEDGDPS